MKFLVIILPFIYNYIFLFYRKSNLFKGYKKWFIVLTYLAIGSIYNSQISYKNNGERIIQIWAFFTPLIFTLYISLCTFISKRINNRDFKLHLRYSNEIDYLNPKRANSKTTDKIISYTAIFLALFLPFLVTLFF